MPDQREMVANYRCQEIKNEAMEVIKADLSQLQRDSQRRAVDDFNAQCKDVMRKAIEYYDAEACSYKMSVVDKVKKEIVAQLVSELTKCFNF